MYNKEIKMRYFEGKDEATRINTETLFNKTEPYEKALNKDVGNFTFAEIVDMYKTWNTESVASLLSRNSWLSAYTIWIIQQDLSIDGQNHAAEIDSEILKKHCVNQIGLRESIFSREQIYQWLNEIDSARDQFIILSLFEAGKGIDYNLQSTVRPEDVTEEGLHFEHRIIQISDRLRRIIRECKEEEELKGARTIKLIDNGYIYKLNPNVVEPNKPARGRSIYTRLMKILDILGIKDIVSTNSIVQSGMIDWVNRRAVDLGITGEEYVKKHFSEMENQYGYQERRKNIFLLRFEEFLVK